jgi:hypothetical protein
MCGTSIQNLILTMTAQFIARLIDLSITCTSGIIVLLMGFRVIGPKPGINEKYDAFHSKWGKHFRWMGPLIIVMSIFGFVVKTFVLGR